jgi:hypothetical protein
MPPVSQQEDRRGRFSGFKKSRQGTYLLKGISVFSIIPLPSPQSKPCMIPEAASPLQKLHLPYKESEKLHFVYKSKCFVFEKCMSRYKMASRLTIQLHTFINVAFLIV